MKKEKVPSRVWNQLQSGMVSNESLDCFESLVGAWWALRKAEKAKREMQESVEQLMRAAEEGKRPGVAHCHSALNAIKPVPQSTSSRLAAKAVRLG